MDLTKVDHFIDVIRKCLVCIEQEMQNSPGIRVKVSGGDNNVNLKVNGNQVLHAQPTMPPKPETQTYEAARKLMEDPEWPEAVPSDLLADADEPEDMRARAVGIMEATIDRNLENLSFLDFGCGDGYTIPAALEKGAKESVGYDPNHSSHWAKFNESNSFFTSNYNELEPGSFDVILLYDVLDHAEKPQDVLTQVGRLLAANGIVYVRCHPWASRHGGHLYRKLNKAYAHLAVDEVHLRKMGYVPEVMRKVLRPLKHYKEIIAGSGFTVKHEYVQTNVLENFFLDKPHVRRSLLRHWDGERVKFPVLDDAKVAQILEIEFVNLVLQQKSIY